MSYEPRPGGIPARTLALLRDEGPLTAAVIGDRLDSEANTVISALASALDHGAIKRERDKSTGRWLYSIGDGFPLLHVEPGEAVTPTQRWVPAGESPGVDIDKIHRNTLWQKPLASCEYAIRDGRLCITFDAEQTAALLGLVTA